VVAAAYTLETVLRIRLSSQALEVFKQHVCLVPSAYIPWCACAHRALLRQTLPAKECAGVVVCSLMFNTLNKKAQYCLKY
jgi:hypothetical protein